MDQQDLFGEKEGGKKLSVTSSRVATRANHSAKLGSAKARRMTATSGRSCLKLLNRKDQSLSWQKTLLVTSHWDSTMCYLTWKAKATPQGRLYFQLLPSTPTTAEIESGLSEKIWPTPQHTDNLANQSETLEVWEKRAKEKKEQGINLQFALRHAVQKYPSKMWPTPTAHLSKEGAYPAEFMRNTPTLTAEVHTRMWPTPAHSDNRDRGNLSTPAIKRRMKKGKQLNLSMVVSEKSGASNPTWVEGLMGYPHGWTALGNKE